MTEPNLELVTSEGRQSAMTMAIPSLGPTDFTALKILSTDETTMLGWSCTSPVPLVFTSAKDGWSCLSLYRQNISQESTSVHFFHKTGEFVSLSIPNTTCS